jgi:hypothetical protein
MQWTHKGLVKRMSAWLKNSKRNTVVISELATRNNETPDVIGWIGGAHSTLIECKTSLSDFRADAKKVFRRYQEYGVGDIRYFAAPPGIIPHSEVPEGWGLLEVHEHHVREVVKPTHLGGNKANECVMLMSALRRLEISTAVYVVHEGEIDNAVD